MSDTIELGRHILTIQDADGKEYPIADPLALMLDLAEEKLTDENGAVKVESETIGKIKQRLMGASGIPAMTASQTIQTVIGLTNFIGELQKKIGLMPNSSPSTDSSPKIGDNASGSTSTSPESAPAKS